MSIALSVYLSLSKFHLIFPSTLKSEHCSPIYRWGNWSLETLTTCPQGQGWVGMQAGWLLSTCFWCIEDFICLSRWDQPLSSQCSLAALDLARAPLQSGWNEWGRWIGATRIYSTRMLMYSHQRARIASHIDRRLTRISLSAKNLAETVAGKGHSVWGPWFSRLRWLLCKGPTGPTFGSINIQGLSKSPECNLLQNQASPNTAPFRTETLILPAAEKVGQGQLTAESLSRNCPWLKRVTSSKVMPLWELRGHPLSNDWLIQEHKGPATWLQSGYFCRAIPALEARGWPALLACLGLKGFPGLETSVLRLRQTGPSWSP